MIEIRSLGPEDAAEWLRLRLEALRGDSEAFGASLEEYQSLSLEEVRKRLGFERDDALVAGAFEDGKLVGMTGFYRDRGLKTRHKCHIWGVYVTPAKRGQGVGKKMLEMVLARARQMEGVLQVMLSVTSNQEAAIRLYRSAGFQPYGTEPCALNVGGKFIDEEYMALRLPQG